MSVDTILFALTKVERCYTKAGWRAPTNAFDDMPSDDLGDVGNVGPKAKHGETLHKETCVKCKGTRRFISYTGRSVGPCFACKGMGYHLFATAPAKREQAKANATARKAQAVQDWAARFSAEVLWIGAASARGFRIAIDLAAKLAQYGSLTPNQTALIQRFMAEDKARNEARAKAQEQLVARSETVEASKLELAFASAKASGLRAPKIRLAHFKFKLAKAGGPNDGAIWVTDADSDTYLGKIKDGRFTPSRDCSPALQAEMIDVMADPVAALKSYGDLTGNCGICSRLLTDPESVTRGIGPICAAKFGF